MESRKPKKRDSAFIDLTELKVQAFYYRKEEIEKQKERMASLKVFPRTPEEVQSFFKTLLKADEKSVVFAKSKDQDDFLKKEIYVVCLRDSIERIEVRDNDQKKKTRYDLENGMFYVNDVLEEDPNLFDSFFMGVFKILSEIGDKVEMLVEPMHRD